MHHPHSDMVPKPSPGKVLVRVDGGGSKTPLNRRVYTEVDAGHGEGAHVKKVTPPNKRRRKKS